MNEVVCPACDEVVYPDCLVLTDHHFGYTWWGRRAKWTHPTFGVVHLCDPAHRLLVYRRDGLLVASQPWRRILRRRRGLRWLAEWIEATTSVSWVHHACPHPARRGDTVSCPSGCTFAPHPDNPVAWERCEDEGCQVERPSGVGESWR